MESRLSSSYTSHQASQSWIKNPSSTMWRTCCLGCYCWWCVNHRKFSTLSFPFCASRVIGEKWETNKQTNKQKKHPGAHFSTVISKHRRKKNTTTLPRRYSPPAKVSNSRTRDANILMTWWWCRSWWRKPGSWKLPKRQRCWMGCFIKSQRVHGWCKMLTSNFGDAPKAFKHEKQ